MTMSQLIVELAQAKSMQNAIYRLLTKDLSSQEKEKSDLLKDRDFNALMINHLEWYQVENPELVRPGLVSKLAEIENKLLALDSGYKRLEL